MQALTCQQSNEAVNEMMAGAASNLHLASHFVKSSANDEQVKIDAAIDVEAHLGKDGRILHVGLGKDIPS